MQDFGMEVENHNDLMPFWLQVLIRLKGQNGGIKFGCRFSLAMPASVLPSAAELRDVRTVEHLTGLALPNPLWESFVRQVGDPGGNLRLLAALPRSVVVQASVQASSETGEGFSAIQAHVGLVWRASQKVLHHWAGLPEEEFVAMDLWEPQGQAEEPLPAVDPAVGGTIVSAPQVKERALKMSALLDQTDDSEFTPASREQLDKWLTNYIAVMGAAPTEDEGPTESQLSALYKRTFVVKGTPYTDLAIFTPYGRRCQKAQKFRVYQPLGDGSYQ